MEVRDSWQAGKAVQLSPVSEHPGRTDGPLCVLHKSTHTSIGESLGEFIDVLFKTSS